MHRDSLFLPRPAGRGPEEGVCPRGGEERKEQRKSAARGAEKMHGPGGVNSPRDAARGARRRRQGGAQPTVMTKGMTDLPDSPTFAGRRRNDGVV